jgi:hypothetical protein
MAESIITRKVAGGSSLDKAIEEYIIQTGNTITAGTFVDFVNNFITSAASSVVAQVSFATALQLEENKVLLRYGNSIYRIVTFDNNVPTLGPTYTLVGGSWPTLVRLDANRVLAVAGGSTSISRVFVINGTEITMPGSNFNFFNNSSSEIGRIHAILLSTNRVLVGFRDGSNNTRTIILSISGSSISGGTVANAFEAAFRIRLVLLDTDKVLLVSGRRGTILTTAGNNMVFNTFYDLDTNNSIEPSSLFKINSNLVLATFFLSSPLVVKTIVINGTVLSANTSTNISTSGAGFVSSDFLNDNTVMIHYNSSGLKGQRVQIQPNGNVTLLNLVNYDGNGEQTSYHGVALFGPDKFFAAYITDSSTRNLRHKTNLFETKVINPTFSSVTGLAKTGGTAGQTIEIYVNKDT